MEENRVIVKQEGFMNVDDWKKVLIIALGTFVGMFSAMSLFTTLNTPPHHRGHMKRSAMHSNSMNKHKQLKAEQYKKLETKNLQKIDKVGLEQKTKAKPVTSAQK